MEIGLSAAVAIITFSCLGGNDDFSPALPEMRGTTLAGIVSAAGFFSSTWDYAVLILTP